MQIRPLQAADEPAVIALWQRCNLTRPWNDPQKDVARKLGVQRELFLVGVEGGAIVSVNYLAVDPQYRRRGFGRALIGRVELLAERGCPKLNLMVRSSNEDVVAFYRRLGYAHDDVVALGKRLIPD